MRLQASVSSGEMQNTPVWTAFITHVLYSPSWKIRAGRIVYLVDLQHIVFTSTYNPRASSSETFSLNFMTSSDAEQFSDAIDKLGARGLDGTSDVEHIDPSDPVQPSGTEG